MSRQIVKDDFRAIDQTVQRRWSELAQQIREGAGNADLRRVVEDYRSVGGNGARDFASSAKRVGRDTLVSKGAHVVVKKALHGDVTSDVSPIGWGTTLVQSYMKDCDSDGIAYVGLFWSSAEAVFKVGKATLTASRGNFYAAAVICGIELCLACREIERRIYRNMLRDILKDRDLPMEFALGPWLKLAQNVDELLKVDVGKVYIPSVFDSIGNYLGVAQNIAGPAAQRYPEGSRERERLFRSELEKHTFLLSMEAALLGEIEIVHAQYVSCSAYARFLKACARDPSDHSFLGYPGWTGPVSPHRKAMFEKRASQLDERSIKLKQRLIKDIPNYYAFGRWIVGAGP